MNIINKFLVSCMSAILLMVSIPLQVSAESTYKEFVGKYYEFDKKSGYEISSKDPIGNTGNRDHMGKLSISGSFSSGDMHSDFLGYNVSDKSVLTINYSYNNALLNTGKFNWHIVEDGDDEIDGIELENDIDTGAAILLTSLDHEHWYLKKQYLDIAASTDEGNKTLSFETNEVELATGCYYRIVVAYKMERQIDDTKFMFIDTSDEEYKKVAEVYEFYASYKSAENKTLPTTNYEFKDRVFAGNDDGFSKSEEIGVKNPHYGWYLGSFYVSGYTRNDYEDGVPVFYKNAGHDDTPGDTIELWFKLNQSDLNKLNGNSDYYIAEDKNGYDQYFEYEKTNFKHGALFIRHTDKNNVKSKVVPYTDFLKALCSPSANTKVQLFEEGDYEVALDYQINEKGIIDSEYDYRIFFKFKIRNGSALGYIFDLESGSELGNKSVAPAGFKIDLAKSQYLNIYVQRMKYVKGENGFYSESKDTDTRYSRPARDREEFKDEGIYNVEFTNPSTGKSETKQIYVGSDNIIQASMNKANGNMSINEIAAKVKDYGATITDDGVLVMPKEEDSSEDTSDSSSETASAVEANTSQIKEPDTSVTSSQPEQNEKSTLPIVPIAAAGGGVVVLIGVIAAIKKSGGKKNEKES